MHIDFPKDLLEVAVNLHSLGLREVAWPRHEALEVVDWYNARGHAILGGDVFIADENFSKINYASANWFVNEKQIKESWLEYTKRSREVAYKFIANYQEQKGKVTLYSVVSSFELHP